MIGEPGLFRTLVTALMMFWSIEAQVVESSFPSESVDAGPGALAGGVLEGQVVSEHEAEFEHAHEQEQEERHDDRELDHALPALAGPAWITGRPGRHPEDAHRTGSISIALDLTIVQPGPVKPSRLFSGVCQV